MVKKTQKKAPQKITILLADDHPLLRAGFSSVLTDSGFIRVIHESETALDACEAYQKLKPDVVVMDILFQEQSGGIDALKIILEGDPDARIIMLSQYDQSHLIKETYQIGAKSFVPKHTQPHQLIEVIKKVHQGEKYFIPDVAQKLAELSIQKEDLHPREILTEKEFKIYVLIAEDNTATDIAAMLDISLKSVTNSLYQVRQKINVSNNTALVKHAIRYDVIKP